MRRDLARAVEHALGTAVKVWRPATGGDVSEAFRVTLADGRVVFVKSHLALDGRAFEVEAAGLRWLGEARAVRVPEVLAWSDGSDGSPAFLALECMGCAPRANGFDEALGRGLASLHRAGSPIWGAHRDGFIASLPQDNRPTQTWAEFWGLRRLEPQLRLAVDRGLGTATMKRGVERVLGALDRLVGPPEPPARLHGDLWSGNVITDDVGLPVLVDPAPYGGHREVDLAMMRLFGGFSARVFEAYAEAYPLAPGHEDRVALYQLYPLLVHVNLFAGGYVASVERTLRAIV
jgi:fructosamine-3-kinase